MSALAVFLLGCFVGAVLMLVLVCVAMDRP
jgi:hypothetical protein